jgi:protease IV
MVCYVCCTYHCVYALVIGVYTGVCLGIVRMVRLIRMAVIFLLIVLCIRIAPWFFDGVKKDYQQLFGQATRVGLLKVDGSITDFRWYRAQLKKLFESKSIKAIVLDVASEGGYSGTCNVLFDEIVAFKKEYPKPIVTFVENVCTSGAYYVAAATDQIIVAPTSLVGSIGARIRQPSIQKLLTHLSVDYDEITSGAYKTAGSPYLLQSPEHKALLQKLCDNTYERFVNDIARVRHRLPIIDKDSWADGKIFTGTDAVRIGIADREGSFVTVERMLRKMVPFEGNIHWVRIESPKSPVKYLLGNVSFSNLWYSLLGGLQV